MLKAANAKPGTCFVFQPWPLLHFHLAGEREASAGTTEPSKSMSAAEEEAKLMVGNSHHSLLLEPILKLLIRVGLYQPPQHKACLLSL